jgi:hypothetical protein
MPESESINPLDRRLPWIWSSAVRVAGHSALSQLASVLPRNGWLRFCGADRDETNLSCDSSCFGHRLPPGDSKPHVRAEAIVSRLTRWRQSGNTPSGAPKEVNIPNVARPTHPVALSVIDRKFLAGSCLSFNHKRNLSGHFCACFGEFHAFPASFQCPSCRPRFERPVFVVRTPSYRSGSSQSGRGWKPFGSYASSGLEQVNLSTRGLHVRIPVISYPQRGDLKLDFFLSLNAGRPLTIPPHRCRTHGNLPFLHPSNLALTWNGNWTVGDMTISSPSSGECAVPFMGSGMASTATGID